MLRITTKQLGMVSPELRKQPQGMVSPELHGGDVTSLPDT